jgi:hypothetical protein
MTRSIQLVKRSLYAVTVLGVLAFGASQAFATTASPANDAARSCDARSCNLYCAPTGGRCLNGQCQCF